MLKGFEKPARWNRIRLFIFFDCKLWLVQMFYNVLTEDGHWAGRGRCCRGVEHLEWLLEYQYPASCSQLKLFGIVLNWDLATYSVHTNNRSAWLGAGVVCVCRTRDCDPVRWTLHKDVNPMKKDHLSFQERFFEGTRWFFSVPPKIYFMKLCCKYLNWIYARYKEVAGWQNRGEKLWLKIQI